MENRPKRRGKHRICVENDIIRRREKEFEYDQMWTGAAKYYEHWDRANARYYSWTSPRYYEDNNKQMEEIKIKRDKEELLFKRKEKLRKLLEEEQRSYEIEMMVYRNRRSIEKPRSNMADIPTDVLKKVNVGLKLDEEEKRRREAESKLYNQWKRNNPIVRQYEIKYATKDLKLSWLDQQIEKRMLQEKEEQENRRILKENEERLRKQKENEEQLLKQTQEKEKQLKDILELQISELRLKQELCEELRKKEDEDTRYKILVEEIEEKRIMEERRCKDRECALYNIRQHKQKLKKKVQDIQESLEYERDLIAKLKQLEVENLISEESKKHEIKEGISEFLNIVRQQQELERQRQKHLEFIFDSEAKAVYEKQTEIWRREDTARKNLVKQVIDIVRRQIDDNLAKNKQKQIEILSEREEMTRKIEDYNQELRILKENEEKRKTENKIVREEDIRVKNCRKKLQENLKLKEIDTELENVRKEEERLQKEIMRIQQRQRPCRPTSSTRIFY
ncbi:unnamed protein product [Phaedon cochleariae]|uniref:Trichoplein keratin filament-binding protein n=1 Tax=Phaedon cochleariae TaxID=80249 RepID=A0A9N9SL89_PHACE|nr:unnamed protein product [Phaedon cochleariae]